MSRKALSAINSFLYFSIKEQAAAKRLVDRLVTSPNDRIILPYIDYPGPIADEILSANFKTLTICEKDRTIRKKFQIHVDSKYPDKRVKIFPDDLFDLSFRSSVDEAQKRCAEIVRQTQEVQDVVDTCNVQRSCDSSVKFLVPLLRRRNEAGFFTNLYYQMALKIGLCSTTLIDYYFLVSERQYNYLDAKPSVNLSHYRSTTILYNTIFKIHKLETFDLKKCFKIDVRKIQGTAASTKSSYGNVYMLWLQPRLEVINNLDSRSLTEFRFLVTQIMHRRTSLVFNSLEKWFQGCSYDLQELGLTKSTRSGDLTVDQYYKLFNYIKNRPDYSRSVFRLAADQVEENTMVI